MQPRRLTCLVGAVITLAIWTGASPARAQNQELNRYYYYPYYYFPHNYWPAQSPKWPERPGAAYMPPPAYQAYPPFQEPHWRYAFWQAQKYYRGFHFWLDQF